MIKDLKKIGLIFTQLIAQGSVALAMVALIFCYDPFMALCIIAMLGLLYSAIYRLGRRPVSDQS